MGTELQVKYQKLAQEYAKLRSHVDVLKGAIKDEKSQRSRVEESLREKTQSLRKHVQENESLEFRNQQLSKRVALLQEEIVSPMKKKKKGAGDGIVPGVSEIHTQELAAKIGENERLHMKMLELTQKSERTIQNLELKVSSLEREAASHHDGVEELNREHKIQVDSLREEKAMLEVKFSQQTQEMENMRQNLERLQAAASEWRQRTLSGKDLKDSKRSKTNLLVEVDPAFAALNVPVVDTKLQAEVLAALKGGMELITTFTTQLSTFHSYLEQRCKCYPVDASSGLHISNINRKLSELLHSSSAYTRPLVNCLSQYCHKIETNPFSQNLSDDLEEFYRAHQKFTGFLETLTPYLQLSLEEESRESVCGSNLTQVNSTISQTFPLFAAAFKSINDYITILITGQRAGVPASNIKTCLEKLGSSIRTLKDASDKLSNLFSSKITLEYQLPNTTQKLNTTNECVVSVLGGISTTSKQLCVYLKENNEVFVMAIEQLASSRTENKQLAQSAIVQDLRMRATNYLRKLKKDCPLSVPYTLAVHNSSSLSSSTESNQTLMKQVTDNKEKLCKLEQEKEQLVLDLQLLTIKYQKEQKKCVSLDAELSRARQVGSPPAASLAGTTPTTPNGQPPLPPSVSPTLQGNFDMVGLVSLVSGGETAQTEDDDTAMIRQHFVSRITDLNNQIQDSDSKGAYYYAECRALHKQLNHNSGLRSKLTQDLQTASDSIQQLQDQLATTSSNYEKQLSTMSDHLCELNDKLIGQSDELDALRKGAKGKKRGK